jgi:hypothetical protein
MNEGSRLLEQRRSRDAADIFGRILLHDAGHAEARRELERAQMAVNEEDRLHDSRIAEAERAIGRGQVEQARELLEAAGAAPPERLFAALDRLDGRAGSLGASALEAPERAPTEPPFPSPRMRRGRRLLVAAWGFAFAVSGAAIAGSWDALTARLTRTPVPSTRTAPESAHQSQPGAGERSLARARRQIEVGDLPGALATLDDISPEDPAYPFARRLRREAQQASIDLGYGE